jgi:predicted DCC family thiol-disulfide oxidoreductase YuxK
MGGERLKMQTQQLPQNDAISAAGVAKPVIFFDDVCIMCNTFVNLLLRVDRKKQFLFAPLTGETARKLLPPLPVDPKEWSMVYVDESGIHDQSDASLQVYRRLGGLWWLLSLARFVPRWIRNPVYRVLARNRYRWFGKRDTCRLPTVEERARFLD